MSLDWELNKATIKLQAVLRAVYAIEQGLLPSSFKHVLIMFFLEQFSNYFAIIIRLFFPHCLEIEKPPLETFTTNLKMK